MDHIANMLVSITNASKVYKKDTVVMHTSLCEKIVDILVAQGYCDSYEITGDAKKKIKINLRYTNDGSSAIKNMRRVSKQSLRRYNSASDIRDVRNGMGLLIVTTNKGVMTGRQARQKNLGGEVLVAVDE